MAKALIFWSFQTHPHISHTPSTFLMQFGFHRDSCDREEMVCFQCMFYKACVSVWLFVSHFCFVSLSVPHGHYMTKRKSCAHKRFRFINMAKLSKLSSSQMKVTYLINVHRENKAVWVEDLKHLKVLFCLFFPSRLCHYINHINLSLQRAPANGQKLSFYACQHVESWVHKVYERIPWTFHVCHSH